MLPSNPPERDAVSGGEPRDTCLIAATWGNKTLSYGGKSHKLRCDSHVPLPPFSFTLTSWVNLAYKNTCGTNNCILYILCNECKYTHAYINKYIYVYLCFFFGLFRAIPTTCGGSQARGPIRAVATGLCQSHSNARSEWHLWPTVGRRSTPQLMATPDP